MATKWRPVLDSQPIQGNDSVEVYYDHFFNWKRKLEEVNYIGGEESYVDDFLYGLEIKLGMRVCGYKWKPHTLYGAFRRALIEENMMKNDAGRVLEEMPHSNSIGIQGAEYVLDENVNVVLDASGPLDVKLQLDLPAESNSSLYINNGRHAKFSRIAHIVAHGENYVEVDLNTLIDYELMMKFSFDPGGCPLPNLKMYEQSTLIEMHEGDVVDGGVVLSVLDLQATLGSLGDLTVNGPDNSSTKAWRDEATFAIKNVHRKYAIVDDAYKEVGEMTQAIRATLLDDEVTNHYAKYAAFNKLILFDPGGNRNFLLRCSREVARPLFGKAHEVFVFEFKAKQNIGSERLGKLEPSMADFQDVAMEMVFRAIMVLMIGHGISSLLYEIFQSFQEAQLDDQVLDPYSNGFYFNKRTIFDPGGDIYYALSYENDALLSLWENHKTVGQSMGVCLCFILALLHDTVEMQIAGDMHILEINFHFWCNPVGMSEYYDVTMMKIVVAILASFVWDLGQDVIFFYIIEDNDVLKRKGIGIQLTCALKQSNVKLNMVAMQIAQMLQLVEYGGYPYDYYMLKTSMVLVYLKVFVWDPGTDFIVNCVHGKTESPAAFGKFFDTSSFVTKAVRRGVSSRVLRDALVIVPCVQWYDCHVRVMNCSPHNIQMIETFSESVEMVILKGVELTLQTKYGWSVWWKAIFWI